ncbi:ROK family protein [Microbacterium sp. NPDC058389]|uniref:ROK family transcriptional regulator n=1 Tax=Microbacterium sp. NPDC058389 TaxID=3346475 RepID=UPI003668EF20
MTTIDPGTPTWLRAHNDRTAFRLLLEHGPLSRSRLGQLSGLSKPTAGQMIQRLERVGLIEPMGETSEARGPNATVYGVRRDSMTGVAISILADAIEAVVTDPTDAEHPVVVLPTADLDRSPESDVISAIDAACRAAGVPRTSVSVVAIGVQAAVDADVDEVSLTDTLPGWPLVGARARIEEATGMTVILENDVNLATIAERNHGTAADAESFAYLWMGWGVGVGVDVAGVVQRGASGSAGEIGYLSVPRSALAYAPDANDFTDLLGPQGVIPLLGGAAGDTVETALTRLAGHPELMSALADRVSVAVRLVEALLDPGLVVLGGQTGIAGGDELAALVQERLDRERPETRRARRVLEVRASGVPTQSILRGARRLLTTHIRECLEETIAVG